MKLFKSSVALLLLPFLSIEAFAQESSRLERYNSAATQLGAYFEASNDRQPVLLVLKDGSPKLFGFLETEDSEGRRIIEPNADQGFQDCTAGAKLGAQISGVGSLQADPVGVIAGMSAAVARYELVDVPRCHTDFQARLFDALEKVKTKADVSHLAVLIGNVTYDLDGAIGQFDELEALFLAEQARIRSEIKKQLSTILDSQFSEDEISEIVTRQMSGMSKKFALYIREQASRQRRQDQISDIHATEEALKGFVLIAFQNDPNLAREISIGVSGLSRIAQTALKLADETNAIQAAALSFNVVGAVVSLMNAFGDKGPTYDEIILEEVRALSAALQDVREEMHGRFDHLETMLIQLQMHLDGRLATIDDKLDTLLKVYRESDERESLLAEIRDASIEYLLRAPFRKSYEKCLDGTAGTALSLKDFGDCLVELKAHAIDVAKLDMITGSGRVGEDVLGAVTKDLLITIDGTLSLGYLRSIYQVLREKDEPALRAIASPVEWSRGVDAFTTLIDRSEGLKNVAREQDRSGILKLERRKIEELIAEGEAIREAVVKLRSLGFAKLLELYQVEISELAELIAKEATAQMSAFPLMVTEERRRKTPIHDFGHSSVAKVTYVFERAIEISHGTLSGKRRSVFLRGTAVSREIPTLKQNDHIIRNNLANEINNLTEANATSMDPVVDRAELQKILRREYLAHDQVSSFTVTANAFIRPSVERALKTDAAIQQLARVRLLKLIFLHHVLLGREGDLSRNDDVVLEVIAALPDKPNQVMALLSDDQLPRDDKFSPSVVKWVTAALSEQAAALENARAYLSENTEMAFVDHYLARLHQLVAEARQ